MLTRKGDPIEQLENIDSMMPIPSANIVVIDDMVQTLEQFSARYGWLPEDGEDIHDALQLGGKT